VKAAPKPREHTCDVQTGLQVLKGTYHGRRGVDGARMQNTVLKLSRALRHFSTNRENDSERCTRGTVDRKSSAQLVRKGGDQLQTE